MISHRTRARVAGVFVVCVALWRFGGDGGIVAASGAPAVAVYPNCDDVCTRDTECTTPCMSVGGEQFQITCDQFTGGECSNTCEVTCGADVDGGTECTSSGGDETTCEEYGVYFHCGDEACMGTETCGNCPGDCGDVEAPTEEGEIIALGVKVRNIASTISGLSGAIAGATACIMTNEAWSNPWDCPTSQDLEAFEGTPGCAAKAAYLKSVTAVIDGFVEDIQRVAYCAAHDPVEETRNQCAADLSAFAARWSEWVQKYADNELLPCYAWQ
jgi:hypothetical protein